MFTARPCHRLCVLTSAAIILALFCALAQSQPAEVEVQAPEPTPVPTPATISERAMRFRPWRPTASYAIGSVTVEPSSSGPDARLPDPEFWRKLLTRAIVFDDAGEIRIIPAGDQPGGLAIDYIDIKSDASGFGVNSDNYSSKVHLYLESVRIRKPDDQTTGSAILEAVGSVNYTGPASSKQAPARIRAELMPASAPGSPASTARRPATSE